MWCCLEIECSWSLTLSVIDRLFSRVSEYAPAWIYASGRTPVRHRLDQRSCCLDPSGDPSMANRPLDPSVVNHEIVLKFDHRDSIHRELLTSTCHGDRDPPCHVWTYVLMISCDVPLVLVPRTSASQIDVAASRTSR